MLHPKRLIINNISVLFGLKMQGSFNGSKNHIIYLMMIFYDDGVPGKLKNVKTSHFAEVIKHRNTHLHKLDKIQFDLILFLHILDIGFKKKCIRR